MAIPKFHKFMLPILEFLSSGKECSIGDCVEEVIRRFNISEEESKLRVPSGTQTVVLNRVTWSLTYMKKANLINSEKRGYYIINKNGIDLLKTKPSIIDTNLLSQYPEFLKFKNGTSTEKHIEKKKDLIEEETPNEIISNICNELNLQLANELLDIILNKSPYYFESLVIDVLTKMGYGDFRSEAGKVTSMTADEGIDGIISQDKLGLENVYIQAKRWKDGNVVGRPELQKFVGALTGKKATKGVFITTSTFSKDAEKYVTELTQYSVKLINGKELANYMIEYNIGVQKSFIYEIKKIDYDYFE